MQGKESPRNHEGHEEKQEKKHVFSTYTYDAFGNLDDAIDPLSLETNYLYTGQQFDGLYTELYNLRARQYDPSNGRFTSRDTWAYDYENPVELNRYVYTANNPVNFYDPTGNQELAFQGIKISSVDLLLLGVGLSGIACATSKACVDRGSDIAQDALDALPSLDDVPWGKLNDSFGTLKRLWDLVRALQNADRFLNAISNSNDDTEVETAVNEAETTKNTKKVHIALGRHGILPMFINSLKPKFVPSSDNIVPYQMWASYGLIDAIANPNWQDPLLGDDEGFSEALKIVFELAVAGSVQRIHFSLDGLTDFFMPQASDPIQNAINFANTYGNGGSMLPSGNRTLTTAIELFRIGRNPAICAVTDFYLNTQSPAITMVTATQKARLCNPANYRTGDNK